MKFDIIYLPFFLSRRFPQKVKKFSFCFVLLLEKNLRTEVNVSFMRNARRKSFFAAR